MASPAVRYKDYVGNDVVRNKKRRFIRALVDTHLLVAARQCVPVSAKQYERWMDADPAFAEDAGEIIEAIAWDLRVEHYAAAERENKLTQFLAHERAALQPGLYSMKAIELRAEKELATNKVSTYSTITVEKDDEDV